MLWSRPCTTDSPGTPGHSSTTVTGALNNYMAEIAIGKAEQERDYSEIERLRQLLSQPFSEQPEQEHYANSPPEWATTLSVSCSS
jgi:uncharacterized protein YdiU (UPF0061 family)